MRIAIVTPLFPPDTGAPAPYVKDLLQKLSTPELSLVCYGHLPESVPGVTYYTTDKRSRLILRLIKFTAALFKASKDTDIIYVQNGPSVELPAVLISLILRVPMVLFISDPIAEEQSKKRSLSKLIHRLSCKTAVRVLRPESPDLLKTLERPEILPFAPYPKESMSRYESAWTEHIKELNEIFAHAKN